MGAGLSRSQKIDRARRNTLKAASLVGAFLATAALHRQASAAPGGNGNGNGGTNGNGGNGNGNDNQSCHAMIDIVRRLRADHFMQDTHQNRYTEKLQNEAADEIERLRATLSSIAKNT